MEDKRSSKGVAGSWTGVERDNKMFTRSADKIEAKE
jgi:hypothetical protein